MTDVVRLEALIGHTFQDQAWAEQALRHPSLGRERLGGRPSNPSLAYLGDAVIELALRRKQVLEFPGGPTGAMTASKQHLVSKAVLGQRAIEMGLAEVLERSTTHAIPDPSERVWAEALEAVVGAVFMDAGFEAAAAITVAHIGRLDKLGEPAAALS